MKIRSALVAIMTIGLVGTSTPALADPIDLSANMTIDNSTFTSGELNASSVAVTFPLVTNIAGDRLYIDLPVGYVLAASAGVSGVQSYDPTTGICGGFDTGITIPELTSGSYSCLSTPDFPFEFLISGNVPNMDYTINFAPGAFRAKTTTVDETRSITITLAMSGDPQVTDDFGSVSVTTLAPKLPDTGVNVVGMISGGMAALLMIGAGAVVVAMRRRATS